jgi:predicted Zn-dependent protease
MKNKTVLLPLFIAAAAVIVFFITCASATSAEEYYSIGMSYFEMGKYEDSEKWLNRALAQDRTMRASEYQLGRIAYETGRYTEAARLFENILKKDPNNVLALKASAYTKIKLGSLEDAEKLYDKVLELEPESTDNGYNYALVLFAMEKPKESEEVLQKYEYAILDDKEALLLLARVRKAQNDPKAIDSYDLWLQKNEDPQVRYEYAIALEDNGFYARALEAARKAYGDLTADIPTLKRSTLRFVVARLILISDPENTEGVTELREAVIAGFDDQEALDALRNDERLTKVQQDDVARTIDTAKAGLPAAGSASAGEAGTASTDGASSGTESATGAEGTS